MYYVYLDTNVTASNCTDYDVQLVDGTTANEGKVLICINGVWGTVCDNEISSSDITVICRQLGYKSYGIFTLPFTV